MCLCVGVNSCVLVKVGFSESVCVLVKVWVLVKVYVC